MAPIPPSDDQVDTMIRARLASLGIDLDQLHPTETDPATGAPSQLSVLASLRAFVASTMAPLAAFEFPPVAPAAGPADAAALAQQGSPPALYPSILTEWTES
jgi:hypothetical protein